MLSSMGSIGITIRNLQHGSEVLHSGKAGCLYFNERSSNLCKEEPCYYDLFKKGLRHQRHAAIQMPHIRYRGQHSALIILHEQWYDSSTMFHPYLLGDVPRNPPSNKTASSLRSLLGRSILAGEMVNIVLRSLNLSKMSMKIISMICRFRNAHPFPFQTTTIHSNHQIGMFRSTGNPTSAAGTIWGVSITCFKNSVQGYG